MTSRLVRWLGGAFLVTGLWTLAGASCGLPLNAKLDGVVNTCVSDSDCGDGARCVQRDELGASECKSDTVSLGKVLIEVQTDTLTYLFADESFTGAPPDRIDRTVPALVSFAGSLRDENAAGCAGDDDSIPAKAELRTVVPYATLSSTYVTNLEEIDGTYRFTARVPPGNYDVYVKPDLTVEGCETIEAPPRFFGNVDVSRDTTFTVPYAKDTFSGEAAVLQGGTGAPVGWAMELVEPKYGLVISNTITLAPPDGNGVIPFALEHAFDVRQMVLRLRRPDGKFTIHWLAEPLGDLKNVRLNLQDLAASPVNQIANTVDSSTVPVPLRATVTIQSQHLLGTLGQGASFRVVTNSDDKGTFSVDLIPGTYRVSLTPMGDEPVSTHIEEWVISPGAGCCGKTFILPPQPQIVGRVFRPDGSPFGHAPIAVTPTLSPPAAQEYFDQARSAQALLPQEASSAAEADGSFELPVDAGSLDFAVRPELASGFPWLVIPSLLVAPYDEQSRFVDLGDITIRAPVIIPGSIKNEGKGNLAGARIRVYVPTSTDPGKGTSVVLLGEADADDDGNFTLVLPPELGTRPAE